MVRTVLSASLLLLAACSDPPAPDKDQPPEPQAMAVASEHDDLAQAVHDPIDRARQAEALANAAATVQRDAIAAAEAGDAAGADGVDIAAP